MRQVNTALLSRCRVFVLQKLATEVLEAILRRAISDNTGGLGATPLQVGCEAPSSSRFAEFGSVQARQLLDIMNNAKGICSTASELGFNVILLSYA